MKRIIIILATVIGLSSCEEVIEIDLNSADRKIVIEGELSNRAEPAIVKISKTVNFTESNQFNGVSGATVIISDETGFSESLKQTSAGIYKSEKLQGIEGKKYTLSVQYEGKTYKAESTMPKQVLLRDINIGKSDSGPNKGFYQATPVYTDPETLGNNYRFVQYANGKIDPNYFINNDNIRNGLPNARPLVNPNFKLAEGDMYTVEMQCIDKATYDYFFTLSQIAGNGPGGGTTPANPPNNIVGGALGYFSAYTSQKINKLVK